MISRLLAVSVLVLVGACSGGGSDDPAPDPSPSSSAPTSATTSAAPSDAPEDAVLSFLTAAAAGDCDAVRSVARQPDQVDCDALDALKPPEDPSEATITLALQDEASSAVVVTWPGTSIPEAVYEVQQVGDAWKVVLDSAA